MTPFSRRNRSERARRSLEATLRITRVPYLPVSAQPEARLQPLETAGKLLGEDLLLHDLLDVGLTASSAVISPL